MNNKTIKKIKNKNRSFNYQPQRDGGKEEEKREGRKEGI
jgi:hypothetical protein